MCRAVAEAAPGIRCELMTENSDEAVLIDSILAGAWGCLSKQDDSGEQLRLTRRALNGRTAYSGRFQPGIRAQLPRLGEDRPDDRLLSLSRQEMNAAIGPGKGMSNRQISQEMLVAERTEKNLVSSVLMKLGMEHRTQAAVLVTNALSHSEDPEHGGYRFSLFPDLIAEVTAALLDCTSDASTVPPTGALRAGRDVRLAEALAATLTRRRYPAPTKPGLDARDAREPVTGPQERRGVNHPIVDVASSRKIMP